MGWGPKDESLWLWLGGDKREITEDRSIWGHILNGLLHGGMGLASALALGCISVHPGFVIPLSGTPSIIREGVQFAGNRQAHLYDRFWDTFEGYVGGAVGWGIVVLVHHNHPHVFGWLF